LAVTRSFFDDNAIRYLLQYITGRLIASVLAANACIRPPRALCAHYALFDNVIIVDTMTADCGPGGANSDVYDCLVDICFSVCDSHGVVSNFYSIVI